VLPDLPNKMGAGAANRAVLPEKGDPPLSFLRFFPKGGRLFAEGPALYGEHLRFRNVSGGQSVRRRGPISAVPFHAQRRAEAPPMG
jgi:hypothetical protein